MTYHSVTGCTRRTAAGTAACLLRAVEGYYRGTPVDVARELGLTAEELGERVTEFARETVR